MLVFLLFQFQAHPWWAPHVPHKHVPSLELILGLLRSLLSGWKLLSPGLFLDSSLQFPNLSSSTISPGVPARLPNTVLFHVPVLVVFTARIDYLELSMLVYLVTLHFPPHSSSVSCKLRAQLSRSLLYVFPAHKTWLAHMNQSIHIYGMNGGNLLVLAVQNP